ncbi:hypothetical protein [Actinophytocola sp.]|uniref:hypothetical protein n=1 Tax=Actinophytocola sp. TaxID=1872138 RepID=UPI002ED4A9DE
MTHDTTAPDRGAELRQLMLSAHNATEAALERLGDLAGEGGDVEYRWSRSSADMRHFLTEAARNIRAAAALDPGKPSATP